MDTSTETAGNRALRRGRISQEGQRYLITTVVVGRRTLFCDDAIAQAAARTFIETTTLRSSRLWCWVLMPDHWHGLVELGADDNLAGFVQRLKSNSAAAVNRARGGGDRVWQPAYHDHALRDDENTIAVARYVIANPKRAGLVERIGDYSFWDAAWL